MLFGLKERTHAVYFNQMMYFFTNMSRVTFPCHMSQYFRFTGPGCMSTNTIIVTCNAVLSLLATFLTLLPCTKKTTGGVVPAALQAAIGRRASLCFSPFFIETMVGNQKWSHD